MRGADLGTQRSEALYGKDFLAKHKPELPGRSARDGLEVGERLRIGNFVCQAGDGPVDNAARID